jgi:hypothetical protein
VNYPASASESNNTKIRPKKQSHLSVVRIK